MKLVDWNAILTENSKNEYVPTIFLFFLLLFAFLSMSYLRRTVASNKDRLIKHKKYLIWCVNQNTRHDCIKIQCNDCFFFVSLGFELNVQYFFFAAWKMNVCTQRQR